MSIFARKNYFYPGPAQGLPDFSQYEIPVVAGRRRGHRFAHDAARIRIPLTRAHLEEDAGKSIHGVGRDDERPGAATFDYRGE